MMLNMGSVFFLSNIVPLEVDFRQHLQFVIHHWIPLMFFTAVIKYRKELIIILWLALVNLDDAYLSVKLYVHKLYFNSLVMILATFWFFTVRGDEVLNTKMKFNQWMKWLREGFMIGLGIVRPKRVSLEDNNHVNERNKARIRAWIKNRKSKKQKDQINKKTKKSSSNWIWQWCWTVAINMNRKFKKKIYFDNK